jgi:signal peptidase II
MSDLVPGAPDDRVEPVANQHQAPLEPQRPGVLFFASVACVALLVDVTTKAWAHRSLASADASITLVKDHLWLSLAYNKGGAWGLLHDAPDLLRRPFFMTVSILAILFIVSLYRRLHSGQWALQWGLPLVLGGALGNLTDRVIRTGVVDFIQYRADWVGVMNTIIHRVFPNWVVVDYWPTFNVADISICIGVGLMAIDMVISKRDSRARRDSQSPDECESPSPSGP